MLEPANFFLLVLDVVPSGRWLELPDALACRMKLGGAGVVVFDGAEEIREGTRGAIAGVGDHLRHDDRPGEFFPGVEGRRRRRVGDHEGAGFGGVCHAS